MKLEEDVKSNPPRKILDRKHFVEIKVLSYEELHRIIPTDQKFQLHQNKVKIYIMVLYAFDPTLLGHPSNREKWIWYKDITNCVKDYNELK